MTNAHRALDLKLGENDADAPTIRDYLKELLKALLIEEEGFSGKRPFGNSGWIYDLRGPIEEAGLFPGYPDWDSVFSELVDAL